MPPRKLLQMAGDWGAAGSRARHCNASAPTPRAALNHTLTHLTFHGVGDPGTRVLEPGEREVWLDVGHFCALLDEATRFESVLISFDDGNQSDINHALPALLQRGLKACFFVVVDHIGSPGYLERSQLTDLAAAGMEIGSHGFAHRAWRRMRAETARREIYDSKATLEDWLQRPVTKAACPFGSYDRSALRHLRRAGFRRVYTSDGGAAAADEWLQARNTVRRDDAVPSISSIVAPAPNRIRDGARAAKRWIKRWR